MKVYEFIDGRWNVDSPEGIFTWYPQRGSPVRYILGTGPGQLPWITGEGVPVALIAINGYNYPRWGVGAGSDDAGDLAAIEHFDLEENR